MKKKVVLITGASAGIGLATAQQLMMKNVTVYAASRRGGTNETAGDGKIIHVIMDVNNKEETEKVLIQIITEQGHLDAVVCNAGNGIAGSIEDTSEEEARYQFETNFFGVLKTIQTCLPVFRQQMYGKIITVSSVAGVVPIPFQAFYSAVKSALMIFMSALSLELKPFNIQCCTILPGDTKTEFTAARKYTQKAILNESVYSKTMKASVSRMEKDEQNGMNPTDVAKLIVKQIINNKTKSVCIPGFQYKIICFLFNILPTKLKLWIIGKLYA